MLKLAADVQRLLEESTPIADQVCADIATAEAAAKEAAAAEEQTRIAVAALEAQARIDAEKARADEVDKQRAEVRFDEK